jgi:nitrite reductase (NADH) small subunit
MSDTNWITVAHRDDLIPHSGIAVWTPDGPVAIFYLPDETPTLYALSHYDPLGKANVLARGIVGDVKGELVVASPLYKQHFSLRTGQCVEEEEVSVLYYDVKLVGNEIQLAMPVKKREGCAA